MEVLICPAQGPKVTRDRHAVELISEAYQQGATLIVIPVERLEPDFFELKTRMAGEILQKFVNYRIRVAILGDISGYLAESTSLRDFVLEANRGNQLWFVASLDELGDRLKQPML